MGLNEDLLNAACAKVDDSNLVLKLIREGADVKTVNSVGDTPLHLAVIKGHYNICNTLIRKGARTCTLSHYGSSPLSQAIANNHENVVRLLLEKGADPNLKSWAYGTVLDVALEIHAKDSIFALLIEHGADVNIPRKRSPLHWACTYRRKELVKLILHKGVSVETLDDKNFKPLDIAKKHNYQEIVDLIEKYYSLWLRLYHAARQGNHGDCEELIKQGALLHFSQYSLYCPVAAATKEGHYEVVKLLLEKRATINNNENNKNSPLYLATKKGHADIAALLLNKGAYPNVKVNGDTLLHVASRNKHQALVRLLIQKGVNPNVKNNDGYRPLHYAVINGDVDTVTCLLEHNANVNLTTTKLETPLHMACGCENEQIIQILLKNGANANAINDQNQKPMDMVNRKWLETQKISTNIKELLTSIKAVEETQTKGGAIVQPRFQLVGDSSVSNHDAGSQCSVMGQILETSDVKETNTKLIRLSTFISDLRDKMTKLELLETNLADKNDTLTSLDRKMKNVTQMLKEFKIEEYDDAVRELKRKVDESQQKKGRLMDEVKALETNINFTKSQAINVYREMAQFVDAYFLVPFSEPHPDPLASLSS